LGKLTGHERATLGATPLKAGHTGLMGQYLAARRTDAINRRPAPTAPASPTLSTPFSTLAKTECHSILPPWSDYCKKKGPIRPITSIYLQQLVENSVFELVRISYKDFRRKRTLNGFETKPHEQIGLGVFY
jgi:hypothetical protein